MSRQRNQLIRYRNYRVDLKSLSQVRIFLDLFLVNFGLFYFRFQ